MNKKILGVIGSVALVAVVGIVAWSMTSNGNADSSLKVTAEPTSSKASTPPTQVASAPKAKTKKGWKLDSFEVDHSMGSEDAPVTLIDYSSLTCGHCGHFHTGTLPILKKEYVDTGKVRIIFRDFPLGELALVASVLPHCAGDDKYFGLLNMLFKSQVEWIRSNDPYGALLGVARFAGLSENDVQACLKNDSLISAIDARSKAAQKKYGLDSTPSFILNGNKIIGALPVEDFRKIIDDLLEEAAQG